MIIKYFLNFLVTEWLEMSNEHFRNKFYLGSRTELTVMQFIFTVLCSDLSDENFKIQTSCSASSCVYVYPHARVCMSSMKS